MSEAADLISVALLLIGSAFLLIGGVGVIRLPDLFTRLHAAGMIDTMGIGSILVGLMFQAGFSQVTIKLMLIIVVLLFTGPVATHAVAKAAITEGIRPQSGPTEKRPGHADIGPTEGVVIRSHEDREPSSKT